MNEEFDLLAFVIERDLPVLRIGLPYIRRFLRPQRIVFIAPKGCLDGIMRGKLAASEDVLMDEDEVVPGLDLNTVRSLVEERGGDGRRAGWYFKQIAILAYALRRDAPERYLTWDADTIPVRHIQFFDEAGRALLAKKHEYHKAYFDTIERLTGLHRQVEFSFIAEHMLFEREIMRELVGTVLGAVSQDGAALARKIIGAVAEEDLRGSGFSEYETYGTFATAKYPNRIAPRCIESMRHGTAFFRRNPSVADLFTISTRYSWASFEDWELNSLLQRMKGIVAKIIGALWLTFALVTQSGAYRKFKGELNVQRN